MGPFLAQLNPIQPKQPRKKYEGDRTKIRLENKSAWTLKVYIMYFSVFSYKF